jgi:hypothetical protein
MPPFKGFIGGSSTGQSLTLDAQRTVNLYVEKGGEGAASEGALLPTPGFQLWTPLSVVADVGCRALKSANGRMFGVMGAAVYEWDVNGQPTKCGAVAVDGNPAQVVFNGVIGNQLGVVSGGNVYSVDMTTRVVTPRLAGGYTHLVFAGGYGLAFQATTGKVFVSALNDLSSWSVGNFFQRQLFADPWKAMFADANNLVWLIGTDTFDVRYVSNNGTTQPFENLSGLVGRYGIAAPFAYGPYGKGNFWLARNEEGIGEFVITRGSIPQTVSTPAVSTAIAGYLRTSRVDDAEALIYQQEGHTFATVNFPAAQHTWAYDAEGQSWAERGKWNPTRSDFDLWAPRAHVLAFGKHLVGDRQTGSIWQMDTSIATEIDGAGIRRLRRAPHLNVEHQRVPISQFELWMDVGVGVAVGQGSDPRAMLRVSEDGGRSWGNERQASVGRIGKFRQRVYWPRLGAAADAVLEVSYSEPTPFRVVGAFLNNAERAA